MTFQISKNSLKYEVVVSAKKMRLDWFPELDHTLKHSIQSKPSIRRVGWYNGIVCIQLFTKLFEAIRITGLAFEVATNFQHNCFNVNCESFCSLLCGVMQNMGRAAAWNQTSFSLCKIIKHIVFFLLGQSLQSSLVHCRHKTMSIVASPAHSLPCSKK